MHFRDDTSTLLLRGINLSDGKSPLDKPSYLLSSLDPSQAHLASYISKPFPLSTARHHLQKLRYVGFNTLRVAVTWEALEHGGPGVYDEEFLSYMYEFVFICTAPDLGFKVIINPHQDLFSRFAGGSGAPLWVLHACGLDPQGFATTEAAIRYAEWPLDQPAEAEKKNPKEMPDMMWTTNHNRLATQTLFALFFGGRDFAPKCTIASPSSSSSSSDEEDAPLVNIQDFLQRHYFAAYARLASQLSPLPIFGYDSMNEPEPGFIGLSDLSKIEREDTAKIGSTPTPVQGMRLGAGQKQTVDNFVLKSTGPSKSGTVTISPNRSCWLEKEDERWVFRRGKEWKEGMGRCVWGLHGVWGDDDDDSGFGEKETKRGGGGEEKAKLLRSDYFAQLPQTEDGKAGEDFTTTYWRDFHERWAESILSAISNSRANAKKAKAKAAKANSSSKDSKNSQQQQQTKEEEEQKEEESKLQTTPYIFLQPPVFTPPPPQSLSSPTFSIIPLSPSSSSSSSPQVQAQASSSGSSSSTTTATAIITAPKAYSPHYYDGLTIMKSHWHSHWNADVLGLLRGHYKTKIQGLRLGKKNVKKNFTDQFAALSTDTSSLPAFSSSFSSSHQPPRRKSSSSSSFSSSSGGDDDDDSFSSGMGTKTGMGIPTAIGEMGIPFPLDNAEAYRTGNYNQQVKALDTLLAASAEDNVNVNVGRRGQGTMGGVILWTYSAENTQEWGDGGGWNGEDLSIWCPEPGSFSSSSSSSSRSRSKEMLQGFRGAAGWCRPFVERWGVGVGAISGGEEGEEEKGEQQGQKGEVKLKGMGFDLTKAKFWAEVEFSASSSSSSSAVVVDGEAGGKDSSRQDITTTTTTEGRREKEKGQEEEEGAAKKQKGWATIYVPWLHYRKHDDDESEELSLDVKFNDSDSDKGRSTWKISGPQELTWEFEFSPPPRGAKQQEKQQQKNKKKKIEIRRKGGGVLSPEQLGTIVKPQ